VVDDGDLVADCVIVAVDVAVLCNNIQSRRPPKQYNYWYLHHFLITRIIHLGRQSHHIGIKRRNDIYEEERTRTRGERKRVNAGP
jgi:ribosomal protein S19E (S16A)